MLWAKLYFAIVGDKSAVYLGNSVGWGRRVINVVIILYVALLAI